jgi:hypothetical protein
MSRIVTLGGPPPPTAPPGAPRRLKRVRGLEPIEHRLLDLEHLGPGRRRHDEAERLLAAAEDHLADEVLHLLLGVVQDQHPLDRE